MNPLKQGLKPSRLAAVRTNDDTVKEVNPLKQGLKLGNRIIFLLLLNC